MKFKRILSVFIASCISVSMFTTVASAASVEGAVSDPAFPTATVTELTGEDIPTNVPLFAYDDQGELQPTGEKVDKLGSAFTFVADPVSDETYNYYKDWRCDYVVSFDQDIPAGTFGLYGKYGNYDIAFVYPNAITAGESINLVESAGLDSSLTYADVNDVVQSFTCGAFNLDGANEDATMTVKLAIWKDGEPESVQNLKEKTYGYDDIATIIRPDQPKAIVTKTDPVANAPVYVMDDITDPASIETGSVAEIQEVYNFDVDPEESAVTSDYYKDYLCDFKVTANLDLRANTFGLYGSYGDYDIAFVYPYDVRVGESIFLLDLLKVGDWPYKDIKTLVQQFKFGAFNLSEENRNCGKWMYVDLVMWEPDADPADEANLLTAAHEEYDFGDLTVINVTIAASARDIGGNQVAATVSGGGDYTVGTEVTLTANDASGYTFDGWYLNGTKVSDNAVYTFTAAENAEYVAVYTADIREFFVANSLTLSGDIGVNFYLDLTPEQAQNATVTFSWNGNTLENVPVEVDPTGTYAYRVSCPVAAAEMTCPVTATLYVDGVVMGTDVYSVRDYADVILSEDYKNDYTGDDYDDLAMLVRTMLDYGAKAQLHFGVNTDDLANDGIGYNMDPVEADQIPTNKDNFGEADFSAYGLEYAGTTVVYLSETTLRHYFKITDQELFDSVKSSVTFDEIGAEEPQAAVYGEKGGFIYFARPDISASNLDTPYALTIGGNSLKFTVLDYSRLVLTSDLSDAEKALAMATYWYNQAANDYFDDAAPVQKVVDLSALTGAYEAQDGDVLSGELKGDYQITIADGATVTLKNATISSLTGDFAGITPLGDATILLEGENTVKGGHENYPGVFVLVGKTLTIDGTGSLDASSNGYGCGIGGGFYMAAGNIVINGGTIIATGGDCAGIGSGFGASCGNITINGGTITANGGEDAAGIGSGYDGSCGNITINGGTVTAIGGKAAPGIGGGTESDCGNITIAGTVTQVTATKGNGAPNSIGESNFGTCGTVTIGDAVVDPITESPYTYEPSQA